MDLVTRSRNERASDAPEQEYWLSYSDLMAGLLMVFALMLVSALHHYGNRLDDVSNVIVLQDELIRFLSDTIEGSDSGLTMDATTGSIQFEGRVLFDEGSAKLRPDGIETLAVFAKDVLTPLLREERYTVHLESIVVEGHTNDNGSYLYNLALSQDRAYEVMRHTLQMMSAQEIRETGFDQVDLLERLLVANGRSYSTPVCLEPEGAQFYSECTNLDKDLSRRIEIRFRLNTEDALRQVRNIVGGEGE